MAFGRDSSGPANACGQDTFLWGATRQLLKIAMGRRANRLIRIEAEFPSATSRGVLRRSAEKPRERRRMSASPRLAIDVAALPAVFALEVRLRLALQGGFGCGSRPYQQGTLHGGDNHEVFPMVGRDRKTRPVSAKRVRRTPLEQPAPVVPRLGPGIGKYMIARVSVSDEVAHECRGLAVGVLSRAPQPVGGESGISGQRGSDEVRRPARLREQERSLPDPFRAPAVDRSSACRWRARGGFR
jgi:hypothetical protein